MTIAIPNYAVAYAIGFVAVAVGVVCYVIAAKKHGIAAASAVAILTGTLFIAGAQGMTAPDVPVPVPPGPSPPGPTPLTSFGESVRNSFTGTKAEALEIAGVFAAYAACLGFDGTRTTPYVSSGPEFKTSWQETQRFFKQSETPYGDRLRATAAVIEAELRNRGVTGAPTFDKPKRAAAIEVLLAASRGLEAVQ